METSQNPYSKPSYRLENYKRKLEQRSNSQDWIFGNVFGKPGGGAPLRDRRGQIISKIKTIADGNIDRLNPEDFSKGDDNVIVLNRVLTTPNYNNNNNNFNNNNINNNYNNYQFQNFNNNYNLNNNQLNMNNNFNRTSPNLNNQQNIQFMNNNMFGNFQNENNKTDNNWNFNQNNLNPNIQNNPYMMQPYPIIMPFPIYNPYQYSNFYNRNNNNNYNNNYNYQLNNIQNGQNLINNNNIQTPLKKQTPKISKESDFNNINQLNIGPDENKIKQQKELEKEKWKRELLQQIDEKRRRDEEEKKKNEQLDREEEIKYQEYLKLKKKQHEQQEQKRRNNLNKKMQMAYGESHLNGDNTQYPNFNNSYSQINENENNLIEDNINNDEENINNNNNENNILIIPNEEIKQQEEFKSFIDDNFHDLKDNLTKEIDEQMKRINYEYQKNYTPFSQVLLNSDPENNLERNAEYQEKKLKHVQELLDQKNMVDYIIGKIDEPSYPQINPEDLKIPIPSYFGINRENPQNKNKNINLHSSSDFLVNNGYSNKFPQVRTFNTNYNNSNYNFNNTNNYNNINNSNFNNNIRENVIEIEQSQNKFGNNDNLISNSMSMSKSLENKSSFIPIQNNENINEKTEEIKVIPNQNDMDKNERKDLTDLFRKLDEIGQLSKNIDPSSRVKGINSSYKIDLNRLKTNGTYERFDYDDDFKDNKNKIIIPNSEKNSVELPSINERISAPGTQNENNTNLINNNDFINSNSINPTENENERIDTSKEVNDLFNGNMVNNNASDTDVNNIKINNESSN